MKKPLFVENFRGGEKLISGGGVLPPCPTEKKPLHSLYSQIVFLAIWPVFIAGDQSFRWEVSLKIHIKEHTHGAPKLSDKEIRRRKKFLAEEQLSRSGRLRAQKQQQQQQQSKASPKKYDIFIASVICRQT